MEKTRPTNDFSLNWREARTWIGGCPIYQQTPLISVQLPDGRDAFVKDERNRFGLGSFKALGGVYAVARMLAQQRGNSRETLKRENHVGHVTTFVCATAGNHGLAVAAGAALFGAKARVHISDEVPESFAARLREKGATVLRSGKHYENSVAAAMEDAEIAGRVLLADGSWSGYTEPPRLVMEGYTVIASELRETFEKTSDWPTDVFLQAGVGGLAAAVTCVIRESWAVQPLIHIVEPEEAPCVAESLRMGRVMTVEGGLSEMGRLDCKTASLVAVSLMRGRVDGGLSISNAEGRLATETAAALGRPSTSSGAAGLAGALKTPGASRPLVILTEASLS